MSRILRSTGKYLYVFIVLIENQICIMKYSLYSVSMQIYVSDSINVVFMQIKFEQILIIW